VYGAGPAPGPGDAASAVKSAIIADAGGSVTRSYCRTTVADRHEELPAASNALKVIVLVPTMRGMLLAVQVRVPTARPDVPVEFDQVTWVTPTLSMAVPRKLMVAALVAIVLAAGYVITSVGGVLSVALGGGGFEGAGLGEGDGAVGAGACCRITDIC
jgi:hypothetical protein